MYFGCFYAYIYVFGTGKSLFCKCYKGCFINRRECLLFNRGRQLFKGMKRDMCRQVPAAFHTLAFTAVEKFVYRSFYQTILSDKIHVTQKLSHTDVRQLLVHKNN